MNNTILKEISKMMIPIIQVFGIYVIFFGHLSPGGGFAGGTIIGVSFILYRIAFGKKQAKNKLKYATLLKTICYALIIYGILKGYSFLAGGGNMHGFNIPLGDPGNIFSGGFILPLNIAVGCIVAITIYFFFSLFYEGEI
ncbi:MnhB domain-containing protein [Brassicibacter mesophilus]|uniref:MnhB domain-containing protein n=1 Tax=Brassicibacter mesophilus TaxID=745119 RepID=UPI003D1D78F3